jgi:hypothetical protein
MSDGPDDSDVAAATGAWRWKARGWKDYSLADSAKVLPHRPTAPIQPHLCATQLGFRHPRTARVYPGAALGHRHA